MLSPYTVSFRDTRPFYFYSKSLLLLWWVSFTYIDLLSLPVSTAPADASERWQPPWLANAQFRTLKVYVIAALQIIYRI